MRRTPRGRDGGIGHTRWATHGHPTETNAHPHLDCAGAIAVVHNGIIENHAELAARLRAGGHILRSDTDTEVLAHLIEEEMAAGRAPGRRRRAPRCARSRGAFSIAVVAAASRATIVAARRVSPLIVGHGRRRRPSASCVGHPRVLEHTRDLWSLDDDQVAELRPGSCG